MQADHGPVGDFRERDGEFGAACLRFRYREPQRLRQAQVARHRVLPILVDPDRPVERQEPFELPAHDAAQQAPPGVAQPRPAGMRRDQRAAMADSQGDAEYGLGERAHRRRLADDEGVEAGGPDAAEYLAAEPGLRELRMLVEPDVIDEAGGGQEFFRARVAVGEESDGGLGKGVAQDAEGRQKEDEIADGGVAEHQDPSRPGLIGRTGAPQPAQEQGRIAPGQRRRLEAFPDHFFLSGRRRARV